MADSPAPTARPADPVGRALYRVSKACAIFGGLLLFAVSAMTTISITGRSLASAPVPGDVELIGIGTGLAVFAFLPYCHLVRGNVIVDFFMSRAPVRAKTACDVAGGLMYLVVGGLLTWRLIFGGLDMYNYSEKSITINFPRWTTFPLSFLFMCLLIAVILYSIRRSLAETRASRFFDDRTATHG
jgi:TRAP-type C4-dicarboxylate transport system permease small subunit